MAATGKDVKFAIPQRARLMELGLTAINKSRNRNLSNADYKAFAETLLSEFPGLQGERGRSPNVLRRKTPCLQHHRP